RSANRDEQAAEQDAPRGRLAEHQPADRLRDEKEQHNVDAEQPPEIPRRRVDKAAVSKQKKAPGREKQHPQSGRRPTKPKTHERVAAGFEKCCRQQEKESRTVAHHPPQRPAKAGHSLRPSVMSVASAFRRTYCP